MAYHILMAVRLASATWASLRNYVSIIRAASKFDASISSTTNMRVSVTTPYVMVERACFRPDAYNAYVPKVSFPLSF